MKKFIASMILTVMIAGASFGSTAGNKDVIGTWKYTVTSAPEGMDKGEVIIGEAENALTGKVVFQNGNSVGLKNVKYEAGELSFSLSVESESVSVKAKVSGKKMTGKVDSSEGTMDFVAEMAEKK